MGLRGGFDITGRILFVHGYLDWQKGGLEPVQSLLRVGHAVLKSGSECSFTTRKLRFFARFRLAWL
ncbi:hypothetical protein D3C73_1624770 [compost metagenome]